MTVAVQMPNQPQDDILTTLARGLEIARSIYGLKSDMDLLKQKKLLTAQAMQDAGDKQVGVVTPKEKAEYITKGYTPVESQKDADITLAERQGETVKPLYLKSTKSKLDTSQQYFDLRKQELANQKLTSLQDSFNKDKVVSDNVKMFQAADRSEELIRSGNPMTYEVVKTQLARMTGEVGNLSEGDIKRFGGSPDVLSKIERWLSGKATGQMTEQDKSDFLAITNIFKQKSAANLMDRANFFAEQKSKALKMPKNELLNIISVETMLPQGSFASVKKQKVNQQNIGTGLIIPKAQAEEPFNPDIFLKAKGL